MSRAIKPFTRWACIYLWTCVLTEKVWETSLLLLTTGTHIWRSPYGLGGYAIPVPDVEVQTLRGTESSFHEFHGNFRKLHQLLKFFYNKKETLDLASLKVSWFIFSVWWQHEWDETPNLLGITLHNSGKTAIRMNDIAERENTVQLSIRGLCLSFRFRIYPTRIHPIKCEVKQEGSSGIIIRKVIFRILFL